MMPGDPMTEQPSHEELARRAQHGCQASFEELVRYWQVPLLCFLRRSASREDAEDLVQKTLVQAYQNLHRYRSELRFAPWLFTIARRLSLNHRRTRRPPAADAMLDSLPDRAPLPSESAADAESRQRLWRLAEQTLSERQVTALWLHYVEDLSVEEVARVLQCTRASVKVMLFRARRKLLPLLRQNDCFPQDTRTRLPVNDHERGHFAH